MVLFRNLAGPSNDLMRRDFIHEKPWQLELRHAGRNPILSQTASMSAAGAFTALSCIRHTGPWGFIDTKIGSAAISTDISLKSPYIPGIVFGSRFERKHNVPKDSKDSVDLSVEFNREGISKKLKAKEGAVGILFPHMHFSVNPMLSRLVASGTAGLSFGRDLTLHLGGEITATSENTKIGSLSYSVGVSMSQTANGKSWVASIIGFPLNSEPFGKITGTIHCKNNTPGAAEVGAEVVHYPQSGYADVTFAGQWFLNQPPTGGRTDTVLKMKLSQDAKLAVALTHRLSDIMTATVGAQVDTLKPDTAKCGFNLNITA